MKTIKRLFLTFIILLNVILLKAQDSIININFNDNDWERYNIIQFDTINKNNIWHIAKPSKKIFNKNIYGQKALLTDSSKDYPVNNKSIVYITPTFPHKQCNYMWFSFDYLFDSDSLEDYGLIELSIDSGKTWIDLIKDTKYTYNWITQIFLGPEMHNYRPILTGTISEWTNVQFNFKQNIWNDSIILRFTFISDSIQSNKEGWMIGTFGFIRVMGTSINNIIEDESINIYPNPVNNISIIDFNNNQNKISQLIITNLYGKIIKSIENPKENILINKQEYHQGLYIIKFILNDYSSFSKKIIIL